jgi:hypothetical protein
VWAQGDALLQLDHLSRLSADARENVDLTIPPELLQLAASAIPVTDPNQATIKELLAGLQTIQVKSFQFDRDDAYTQADIDAVQQQLTGWTRIVNLQEPGESVGVYLLQEGGQTRGLTVVLTERRELTVVNIVGPIDLARLAAMAGQFGIPKLPIPTP